MSGAILVARQSAFSNAWSISSSSAPPALKQACDLFQQRDEYFEGEIAKVTQLARESFEANGQLQARVYALEADRGVKERQVEALGKQCQELVAKVVLLEAARVVATKCNAVQEELIGYYEKCRTLKAQFEKLDGKTTEKSVDFGFQVGMMCGMFGFAARGNRFGLECFATAGLAAGMVAKLWRKCPITAENHEEIAKVKDQLEVVEKTINEFSQKLEQLLD